MPTIYQIGTTMAIKTIGIDVRDLHSKGAGKGRWGMEIVLSLIKSAPNEINFLLFTKNKNNELPEGNKENKVEQVIIKGNGLRWHLNLRKYLKNTKVDFYLSPTSFIYPALAPRNQKFAIVVHDMIAFIFKKNHHWFPTLIENITLKRAIKKASFIVTISKNTKADLHRIIPISKNKHIVMAGAAVSKDIHKASFGTMQLPEEFLLCVGTLSPRKNITSVIVAFEKLAKNFPNLNLVIAGGRGWKDNEIFKAVPDELKERINFLGYVEMPELSELYSRAKMLVFPSFYEGFGIPPLEAMACGCPVVCSGISSLPEVVGDAAILVDPNSIESITNGISQMMNKNTANEYIKKGYLRVHQFSWEKSADTILNQILKAIDH